MRNRSDTEVKSLEMACINVIFMKKNNNIDKFIYIANDVKKIYIIAVLMTSIYLYETVNVQQNKLKGCNLSLSLFLNNLVHLYVKMYIFTK